MKKVLIMVVSSQQHPYDRMAIAQSGTWDVIEEAGCETIFYYGQPLRPNTEKRIFFNIPESYYAMSPKMIEAFKWALENKEFDYVARVNSSTYVKKDSLIKHIQSLPADNVFNGLVVDGDKNWVWGPFFILSKDVVRKIVDNADKMDYTVMDDIGTSKLVIDTLGIQPSRGTGCSIDKTESGWRAMCYGTESFEFTDFADIVKAESHWAFRCKQDHNRMEDEYVMKKLFYHFNKKRV